MALKWQTLAAIISLPVLLLFIANLAGVSVSDDGDKACTNCYSQIKLKSTYWEIKVTFAGDDMPTVFKKRTRSRTLWLNLDKIKELVTTDPAIKVDILVPAIKRTATFKHPDYGYLRPLKEGDTLIKRNTKSRPSPSRIILHGTKEENQVVKWSFDLEHWLLEDINIDPIWLATTSKYNIVTPIGEMKRCENITKEVYSKCTEQVIHYYNYTHYNNITSKSESKTEIIYSNRTYNCNFVKVLDRIECKTTGFKRGIKIVKTCPDNFRCDIIGRDWCEINIHDGDRNFNWSENDGRGWGGGCVPHSSLR